MRIVSLLPAATEIACALGLADNIMGISHDCDFPDEIRNRPRVTSTRVPAEETSEEIHRQVHDSAARGQGLYTIDLDRLATLAPDIVLTQRQCSVCAVGETDAAFALAKSGCRARLVTLEAKRFAEMPDDIRRLGRATGRMARAEALIEQLQARLQKVRCAISGAPRPRVFCLSWFNPLMAAGHWVTEMVELAGGEDGLGSRGDTSTRLDFAALEAFAPEVVLLLPCGFTPARARAEWEAVRDRPVWKKVPAVKVGKVFVVEGNLFHRPGPRLADGVELLVRLLHPDRWPVRQMELVQRAG